MLYYLASPYTSGNSYSIHLNYALVLEAYANMTKQGLAVISPIVLNHQAALHYDLPKSWDFWEKIDLDILSQCTAFVMLKIPGYDKSEGLQAELKYFKEFRSCHHIYTCNLKGELTKV